MDTVFSVKTPVFEGPLDLLLSLIEDRKLLISDVSLTKVADDFIGYIQNQVAFPVGTAANFILVSATLLLLKSRALLPVLSLTKDEEGDIKDLEFRLKLYQLFRNVATELGQRKQRMFFWLWDTHKRPSIHTSGRFINHKHLRSNFESASVCTATKKTRRNFGEKRYFA